jgi:glycosyltransferase involved in cell wall biosynthesis
MTSRQTRRRIAILVGSMSSQEIGGMQIQAEGAARELARDRDVVVLTRDTGHRFHVESRDGYTVRYKPVLGIPVLRPVADLVIAFLHLVQLRPRTEAILAYQTLSSGLIAVISARILRLPSIIWLRNASEYERIKRSPVKRFLSSATWLLASRVLVQTERMRLDFLDTVSGLGLNSNGRFAQRVAALPNGVDLDFSAAAPDRADQILYVGRLHPSKGLRYLVDAVRSLPENQRPRMYFIGDAPRGQAQYENDLKETMSGLAITMTGRVSHSEVRDYLLQGGIFVLPSLIEGMPNALLEAMAVGIPCIATAVGGVPDIIRNCENGLIVPPGDSSELANAIARLQGDPELRSKLSHAGRQTAAEYTWIKLCERLSDEIQRSHL